MLTGLLLRTIWDATSQNVANVYQKKSQFLLSQDKHSHEMRFFAQSTGAVGWMRVPGLILDHLPTQQKMMDAARRLASFQKLQTATVLEFASMGARSLFNTVMALVESTAKQSVPDFQGATDTDLRHGSLSSAARMRCCASLPQSRRRLTRRLTSSLQFCKC